MMLRLRQEEARLEQVTVQRRSELIISTGPCDRPQNQTDTAQTGECSERDLDEIIDSLIAADQAAKLSNLQDAE